MNRTEYDVAVVGARCAGAALGAFLARSGARVLLVDRDPLPSDQVLSTHTIHPPGMDVLDALGVGDAVRARAPVSRTVRLARAEAFADARFPEGRDECCPRRERLDGLLQEAAVAAGAELRDRTRVTDVLLENGRAAGLRLSGPDGAESIRAGLVVGADGRRSTVAERVGAEEYLAYDAPRAMYWAYWAAPPAWRTGAYPFDMYLAHRDRHIRVVFQTDDDRLLIGALPPVEEGRTWKDDPLGRLRSSLALDPVTESLVRGREPEGKVRGTVSERYFFRRAAGPGWALVGDAGHHKDFVIGDGITEALVQARSLSRAVAAGGDRALVRWWRARDVDALPRYCWGRDEGAPGGPGIFMPMVLGKVARSPALRMRMSGLPDRRFTPYDVLPAPVILSCALGALVRGRLGVVPEILAQGRRAREFGRMLRERKRLLAEAERAGPERAGPENTAVPGRATGSSSGPPANRSG